ncbi:nuclear transport factor 2 family protein [Brevundimonas sp.]|uniref:nuclear transport factor 2 family protein n=1 Tax=Brevundimonas sp. TaxID=1871086 RepID=UPI002FCB470C
MTATASEAAILALADRFIAAIQKGDTDTVKACYHPDARIWLNTLGQAVDRDANIEVLTGFIGRTSSRDYQDRKVRVTADGYVQQHVLHAVHVNGPLLVLPAVLVCTVKDGQIIRLEEYFDSAPLQIWREQAVTSA